MILDPPKFQFVTSQRMDVWRMHHPIPIAHAFHPVLVAELQISVPFVGAYSMLHKI